MVAVDGPDAFVQAVREQILHGVDQIKLITTGGIMGGGHDVMSAVMFLREELSKLGVVTSRGLWEREPLSKVMVAGVVTHRQRPMTAQGVTFLNLEDETGLINVICSAGVWTRYRRVARTEAALLVRGLLESVEGVVNLIADRIEPYELALDDDHLEAAIDMVVRVVLSHVMQPSGPPERTAADIAWIAARVLRSA